MERTGDAPLHGDINVRYDLCMDGYSYHIKEYGCNFLSIKLDVNFRLQNASSSATITYYIEAT